MFTKFQLGIIHAVSTILFQQESLDYWTRSLSEDDKGYNFEHQTIYDISRNEDGTIDYGLFVKIIDNKYYLAVESCIYDEYGGMDDREILGFIPINNERKQWEVDGYCYKVEALIKRY